MTNVYAGNPVSYEDIKILVDINLKRAAAVTDIQMKQIRTRTSDQKREFWELEKNLSVLETDTNVKFPM
jgi:hypothetical protein